VVDVDVVVVKEKFGMMGEGVVGRNKGIVLYATGKGKVGVVTEGARW
jgi:hypothetical protein